MKLIPIAVIALCCSILAIGGEVLGNATKVVDVNDTYFVGEKIVVRTNFAPEKLLLIDPNGRERLLEFKGDENGYFVEVELDRDVVLGEYRLIVDDVQKSFILDFCELNVSYEDGILNLTAKTFFSEPRISYSVGSMHGEATGFVSIPLEVGANEIFAKCGNSVFEEKVFVDFSLVYEDVVFAVLDGKRVEAKLRVGDKEFLGFLDPRDVNVTSFRVEAEYGHLRIAREFDFSFGLREVYFPGEKVVIRADFAREGKLVDPAGRVKEFEFDNGIAEFELSREVVLGEYRVSVGSVEKSFYVDSYEVSADFEGNVVRGKVFWHFFAPKYVEVVKKNESFAVELVNDSFEFESDEDVLIRCGNAELFLKKREVELRDHYFLGEVVEIKLNFDAEEAKVFAPWGEFSLRFENMTAEFVANETGIYRVVVSGIEKSFVVDSCEVNASFVEGEILGRAKCLYEAPGFVHYNVSGIEGFAEVVNESFRIKIDLPAGLHTATLKYGNSQTNFEFSVEERNKSLNVSKDHYFLGEVVEIVANFKPRESYLTVENESIPIEFEEVNGSFVHRFRAEKVGIYGLRVDEFERSFSVDSCELDAKIIDQKAVGKASAKFVDISAVEFYFRPLNVRGIAEVKNGSFEIQLPEKFDELLLSCGNSVLTLKKTETSDSRVVKVSGKDFEFSIDRGRFESLEFDGEEFRFTISGIREGEEVGLRIKLPFEIPEGLHVYYWKEVGGKLVAVDYALGDDRRSITLKLRDGETDEDMAANGVIVDPIKLYIPKFEVEKELKEKKGKLKVKGEKSFEISFESTGKLKYLAFVDPENLPSRPAEFPYGLIKFSLEVEKGGEAEIRITYPSLENFLDDSGKVTFFKFNPSTLEWSSFDADVEGNAVVLRFRDGGFGDEDGEANGVISDDGGVGWVGYAGSWSASICREGKTNEVHTYWVYIPSGDTFNVSIYDGDDLEVRVYYPNNTLLVRFNARSNERWDNFTMNTNGQFGWWRIEIFEDSWFSNNGNYYGLRINGTDEINLRVNHSYSYSEQTFNGTPDSVIVGSETGLSITQNYYVVGDSFTLAIYDPDRQNTNALNVTIYHPNGTVFRVWQPTGNNQWNVTSVSGEFGVWRINVTEVRDHNDYSTGGNHFILAVNLSEGLYFKPPNLLNISGRVMHDLYPLGRNDGEDKGISAVEVLLVEDMNGNRVPDSGDRVLRRNTTDANGNFSFRAVKDITRTYFVVVNSKSISATNSSLSYNPGFSVAHVWAEQTYQSNEKNYAQVITFFFGGRNAERSDNVSVSGNNFLGWAEHYLTINSSYNNESLYFGFNFSVVVNTMDSDDDTANPRFCQGCFRQFVLNSNAIAGKQRSYFVMAVGPNSNDSEGKWYTVKLDPGFGGLNITDPIEINGTYLNPDMTPGDDNPGFVSYGYENKALVTVSSQTQIPVGVGSDGIPFSGDEATLRAIPKPEIEIYGFSLNPILNFTANATNSEVRNIAFFGSQSNAYPGALRSYAENLLVENVFAGLRANGSDPKVSGLNRTGGANFWIEGNNTTVRDSIVAFAERYGLLFYTSSVKLGRAENVIAFRNGLLFHGGDNLGAESGASNVTFSNCISARASGNGIESHLAIEGIAVFNCTIEGNGIGNETGYVSEIAGVRINARNSVVANSLIRDNGVGVLVSNSNGDTTKQVFNVTITKNSIYNNSRLGIDLANGTDVAFRGDNVTLNDGSLNCGQPNCGMDYPVITYAELDGTELYVEGFIGSSEASATFANAVVEIYLVRNSTAGDNLLGNNWSSAELPKHYGEGFVYLGTISADPSGNFSGSIDVGGKGVDWASQLTAIATLNGNTSEFGPNFSLKRKLNLSAEVEVESMNVSIKVKAFEKARNVKVYWQKPSGIEIASMSGDYNDTGNDGDFYWWKFNKIDAGEEKFVYLNLSGVAFSLSEALNVGVDP